jgi:hypothetical protein
MSPRYPDTQQIRLNNDGMQTLAWAMADGKVKLSVPVAVNSRNALVGAANVPEHCGRFLALSWAHACEVWGTNDAHSRAEANSSPDAVKQRQCAFHRRLLTNELRGRTEAPHGA